MPLDDKMIEKTEVENIRYEGADPSRNPHLEELKQELDHIDPVAEKKLLRRIDLHLIPILFLLFLCAFIDR